MYKKFSPIKERIFLGNNYLEEHLDDPVFDEPDVLLDDPQFFVELDLLVL